FFGSRELESFLPHCKKLIGIIHGDEENKPLRKDSKKQFANEVEERLKSQGIRHTVERVAFEFGQPFQSIEDAKDYITSRSTNISQQDVDEFLAEVIETGEEQHPYFRPRMRPAGIFEVEGQL